MLGKLEQLPSFTFYIDQKSICFFNILVPELFLYYEVIKGSPQPWHEVDKKFDHYLPVR
jgi:hypothetical protein